MKLVTMRGVGFVALLGAAGACAGGGGLRVRDLTPEMIPSLEAEQSARPQDATVAGRLGVAYFRAARYNDARRLLDSANAWDPQNGMAAIYLGMTAEQQGDFTAARSAYERYVAVARSNDLRGTARARLAMLQRRQLEFEARQALAAEATLTQSPPDPNTVAVMPFTYTGANEELRPLSRGFAQLVITDLAKSRQIIVLERERMQAMISEMRLSEEGRADPQTAARSGRLLRASRVVQGTLTDVANNLRADAAVVDVNSAGVAAARNATAELSQLFDREKDLVFSIFDGLGIQLTPAEQAAINQRPTQNLQAFLAYSRGLEAEDQGDYAAAAQFYSQAVRIDPGFQAAQQGATESSDLQQASQQSVADVDVQATQNEQVESGTSPSQETLRDNIQNTLSTVAPPPTSIDPSTQSGELPPTQRDTQAESGGTEGVRPPTGRLLIIIVRP